MRFASISLFFLTLSISVAAQDTPATPGKTGSSDPVEISKGPVTTTKLEGGGKTTQGDFNAKVTFNYWFAPVDDSEPGDKIKFGAIRTCENVCNGGHKKHKECVKGDCDTKCAVNHDVSLRGEEVLWDSSRRDKARRELFDGLIEYLGDKGLPGISRSQLGTGLEQARSRAEDYVSAERYWYHSGTTPPESAVFKFPYTHWALNCESQKRGFALRRYRLMIDVALVGTVGKVPVEIAPRKSITVGEYWIPEQAPVAEKPKLKCKCEPGAKYPYEEGYKPEDSGGQPDEKKPDQPKPTEKQPDPKQPELPGHGYAPRVQKGNIFMPFPVGGFGMGVRISMEDLAEAQKFEQGLAMQGIDLNVTCST